ncbi:NTP transferase domain-containing protein [Kribbella sp. NPDC051620]|uniref:nucleotidyltransferase family protein n=1 Tax=Kribbella sp. NPDC051620 TaxID=3364120 RepID=UPI0037ADBC66
MKPAVVGVLLAAGGGRRMGRPKALVTDASGVAWVVRSVDVLRNGGCAEVAVVLGAASDEAALLLANHDVTIVPSPEWSTGMGASVRRGLTWARSTRAEAALVHLVDLPDVGADVVRRVLATGIGPDALARASYGAQAGHPVLIGRSHFAPAVAAAVGDRGAGPYLRQAGCLLVPCDDLAHGNDQDYATDP